jgi:hypothetical protein
LTIWRPGVDTPSIFTNCFLTSLGYIGGALINFIKRV